MTGNQRTVIRLTGISADAHHGVFDWERERPAPFIVDIVCEFERPPRSGDDLATTVDYSQLAREAVAVMKGAPVALIETLAERIAESCLAHPWIQLAEVTVHKPEAPLSVPFADVAVTVVRSR